MPAGDEKRDVLPLLPSQAWFLEVNRGRLMNPHRWNIRRALVLPEGCGEELARAAVEFVWRTHDALRATFHHDGERWRQHIAAPSAEPPFRSVDVSRIDADRQPEVVGRLFEQFQNTLHIEQGPLIRFLYVHGGPGTPPRLVVVVHHLVCDNHSLTLLVSDIDYYLNRVRLGQDPKSPHGQPYADAVLALSGYAASDELRSEIDGWTAEPWEDAVALPTDLPAYTGDSFRQWTTLHVTAGPRETASVARLSESEDVPQAHVALCAVADTITAWAKGPICVETLWHGRQVRRGADGPSVLSPRVWRTVGWFSTSGLTLVPPRGSLTPGDYLRDVSRKTAAVPNQGSGPALLRGMAAQASGAAVAHRMYAACALQFGYFSTADHRRLSTLKAVSPSKDPLARDSDVLEPRLPMHVRAGMYTEGLRLWLDYDRGLYRTSTVEDLAGSIRQTLADYATFAGIPS